MTTMNDPENKKSVALAIGSAVLALAFVADGGRKLAGAETYVVQFQQFGLPPWFMYFTGVIEVGAGLLLLARNSRFFGAATLAVTMVGALCVHVLSGGPLEQMIPAAVLLVAVSSVVWATRDQLASLLRRLGLGAR